MVEETLRHSETRGIATAVLRIVTFSLRHPAVWSWPLAAWLTYDASYSPLGHEWALDRRYLPALGLILLGCLPSFFAREARRREAEAPFLSRRLLLWLTVVVLVGSVAVRLWKIDQWPPDGIGFEEFQLAGRAPMADGARNFLFLYSQPGEHTLTVYAMSLVFTYLGTGFLHMRLAFMIGGIIAPFLLYAVCRKLVTWEVSLFATALFAVSWWEIAASRVADEIFFPMWIEIAILWLLIHFEDTGRSWAAYFVALLSGLLIYEYTSYHLVVVVVVGYLVARGLVAALQWLRAPDPGGRRRRGLAALRTYGPGVVAMVLVWVIIAHFQLVDDIRRGMGSWFSGGVGGHAEDQDGLVAQLSKPTELPGFLARKLIIPVRAAYLPGQGDFCRHLGIGGDPAFDMATALWMGLGFVLVAATFWWRFHALVLAWALLVICGAALFPANANLHRYYTGLPFYYLLIALGADVLWRWLRQPPARYALLALFAVSAAYATVANVDQVGRLMMNPELHNNWIWPRTEIAHWIRARDRSDWFCVLADDDASIYGANPLLAEWKWMLHDWNVRVSPTGEDCIPSTDAGTAERFYILALKQPTTDPVALLRKTYPNAEELDPIEVPMHEFKARTFRVSAYSVAGGSSPATSDQPTPP